MIHKVIDSHYNLQHNLYLHIKLRCNLFTFIFTFHVLSEVAIMKMTHNDPNIFPKYLESFIK